MDLHFHYVINSIVCWFIVLMALVGYFLTLKRTGEKWPLWVTLFTGWAFLAISNSLAAMGVSQGASYLFALWLSSFVMVVATLVLLFLKLTQVIKVKK
jgi:hypothetical protein